ncbi:MAG TPA: hypothetical protein VN516_04760, partial [Candidatus Baltobacteraceae bacterium]|nr:hypothetical protein [Candidatus Baltobacteraceae bacterium]
GETLRREHCAFALQENVEHLPPREIGQMSYLNATSGNKACAEAGNKKKTRFYCLCSPPNLR